MSDIQLSGVSRKTLDKWTEHGIPDDQSTREYALTLLLRLWADYRQLDALVEALDEGDMAKTIGERDEALADPEAEGIDESTWALMQGGES